MLTNIPPTKPYILKTKETSSSPAGRTYNLPNRYASNDYRKGSIKVYT